MSDESPIVDIRPFRAAKRASTCTHEYVEVDDTAASLTCGNRSAEIDPWWYLRKLANDEDGRIKERLRQVLDHNQWVERANATIARLNREIADLTATKNRLWNERMPDGRLLGDRPIRRRRNA